MRIRKEPVTRTGCCAGTLCMVFIVWCSLLAAEPAFPEIIDRIAAVVGSQIITQSDIRHELKLRAALGEPSVDESMVVQSLIEGLLIDSQMVQFPGVDITAEEIENQMKMVQDPQGLPAELIREDIRKRLARIRFFDLRFRQFISASDEEVQQYYETIFVPEARARGLGTVPALNDVVDLVRSNVINEKLSREVEVWIDALRGRSSVEVFE